MKYLPVPVTGPYKPQLCVAPLRAQQCLQLFCCCFNFLPLSNNQITIISYNYGIKKKKKNQKNLSIYFQLYHQKQQTQWRTCQKTPFAKFKWPPFLTDTPNCTSSIKQTNQRQGEICQQPRPAFTPIVYQLLSGQHKNTNKKPQSRNNLEDTFWHIQMMRFSLACGTRTSYEKLKNWGFYWQLNKYKLFNRVKSASSLLFGHNFFFFFFKVMTTGSPWDPDYINLSSVSRRYQKQDIKEKRKEVLLIPTLEIKTWSKSKVKWTFLVYPGSI